MIVTDGLAMIHRVREASIRLVSASIPKTMLSTLLARRLKEAAAGPERGASPSPMTN
jgi:hypothetical protein